jgi:sortase (surface protein transpeptidase)
MIGGMKPMNKNNNIFIAGHRGMVDGPDANSLFKASN